MAYRRWFPRSLQEQAAFYQNFTRVFIEVAPGLGFTAEETAKLEADNAVMQYLAQTEMSLNAFKSGFVSLRKNLTMGEGGKPLYLQYTPLTEPPVVPFGMFARLFRLADRICVADGYTPTIGAQLRILPKTQENLRPEDLELKLKATTLRESTIEIRFVRGRTSGINLYFRRAGSDERHDLGRFFHSPIIIEIPLIDSKPEQIYVSGRYLIGNKLVGNPSPAVELLIAP